MRLTLVEDDKYYYDKESAARAVQFIETYCYHFEDKFAGKPFILIDWQRQTILDLFGWKHRLTNLRRFRKLFLEIARGSGKTPLIAAIGLYMLLSDNERGAQVWSVAINYKQAALTFEAAQKMIKNSPPLMALVEQGKITMNTRRIEVPSRDSYWGIFSGEGEGKDGFRPSCTLADEASKWGNREFYDDLDSNMIKRSNPMMCIATNAGTNKECIGWELHSMALDVLDDQTKDESLYPVIYTAPKDCNLDDIEAIKMANPSLGDIIPFERVLNEAKKAKTSHALEARYRRLFLTQWIQGSDRWLNMAEYDAIATGFDTTELAECPLTIGIDLSLVDDLTSLALVWRKDEQFFAKTKQYIPRATALKYNDQSNIPYAEWEKDGYVNFINAPTIGPATHRRLIKYILKLSKKYNLQAVCYDRWHSSVIITKLEAEGITCIPVSQDFDGLAMATSEFERRIKDRSITLSNDPCLRWQASNAEVIANKVGGIRLVKPNRKAKYAGERSKKIDSLFAILNAMSYAIKQEVSAGNNGSMWKGELSFVSLQG